MAKNGNYIIISVESNSQWVPIAGVKSDDISTRADTIEVASSPSGVWREYIAGRKDWSVSVNYLLLADAGMLNLLNIGTTYHLKIGGRSASGANTLKGYAILTACKVTATRGNLVQGSFSFQGSGALEPFSTT